MPLNDWSPRQGENEGILLASAREYLAKFDLSIHFRHVPSQLFFWISALMVLFTVVKAMLTRWSPSFRQLDYKRRVSTICYAVQLLVTSAALIVMVYFGKGALLHDHLQHHYIGQARVQDWGENLDWSVAMDRISTAVGFALLPVLCWYMVELAMLAAVGCASVWIVTHHIFSIVLVLYIVAPGLQCVDLMYFRLGFVLTLHAVTEQPQFAALILHRLNAVHRLDIVFALAAGYSLIQRVALYATTLWIYAEICWQRAVFTKWDMFHRYFLPPTVTLLFAMQVYPVYVYWTLYRQHRRKLVSASEKGDHQSAPVTGLPSSNLHKGSAARVDTDATITVAPCAGAVTSEASIVKLYALLDQDTSAGTDAGPRDQLQTNRGSDHAASPERSGTSRSTSVPSDTASVTEASPSQGIMLDNLCVRIRMVSTRICLKCR